LGIPDLRFTILDAIPVIIDWKVNGYCGKSNTSPKKQYAICRDGWVMDSTSAASAKSTKATSSHGQPHKDFMPEMVGGIQINNASTFESIDETWATQLAIYGWLMGEPVGSPFIVGIEQICGKCKDRGDREPLLRIASHRARIGIEFQHMLYTKAVTIWRTMADGHIFSELSREESDAKCAALDDYHFAFKDADKDSDIAWFRDLIRQHRNY
jgi:hypothetical protein